MEENKNRKQLSFSQLCLMDNQTVLVKDLSYDIYDKVCQIKVNYKYQRIPRDKKWRFAKIVSGIDLLSIDEDNEYIFSFDHLGTCLNGDFVVYSLKET